MIVCAAVKHFSEIISQIVGDWGFEEVLENRTPKALSEWKGNVNNFELCNYLNKHFHIESGMSRFTFIDDDYGYVMKIPFIGRYDYGEEEYANYIAAKEFCVDSFFAPCEKEKLYVPFMDESFDVYIMPYVEVNEEGLSQYIQESYPDIEEEYDTSYFGVEEDCVSELLAILYGDDEYARFNIFCYKQGINDIHGANVGWLNGKLVVIDYAGWRGI